MYIGTVRRWITAKTCVGTCVQPSRLLLYRSRYILPKSKLNYLTAFVVNWWKLAASCLMILLLPWKTILKSRRYLIFNISLNIKKRGTTNNIYAPSVLLIDNNEPQDYKLNLPNSRTAWPTNNGSGATPCIDLLILSRQPGQLYRITTHTWTSRNRTHNQSVAAVCSCIHSFTHAIPNRKQSVPSLQTSFSSVLPWMSPQTQKRGWGPLWSKVPHHPGTKVIWSI